MPVWKELPGGGPSIHANTLRVEAIVRIQSDSWRDMTCLLPVQNELASLASHTAAPRSSCGRPTRAMGVIRSKYEGSPSIIASVILCLHEFFCLCEMRSYEGKHVRCVYPPWTDRIDAYSSWRELTCHATGHLEDRALRSVVCDSAHELWCIETM